MTGALAIAKGNKTEQSFKLYSKSRKKRDYPEARLQRAILQILKLCSYPGVFYFHPPNGMKSNARNVSNLKSLGMLPGVSDLVIINDGLAFFLEIKAKGEKPTEAQLDFGALASAAMCPYTVVDNIDAAITVLQQWRIIKPTVSAGAGGIP